MITNKKKGKESVLCKRLCSHRGVSKINMTSNAKSVKAGAFYTLANVLEKSMAFITTPIFISLLTKNEFASFSSFASWQATLLSLCSLQVYQTISRAKLDYENRINEYISSVLPLHVIASLFVYALFLLNKSFFTEVIQLDSIYLGIMFTYLITVPAYHIILARERANFRYKAITIITIFIVMLSIALSLILMYAYPDRRLLGRIVGQYLPVIIAGIVSAVILFLKGKRIDFSCWKYALALSVPLTIHYLGMQLIISVNRMLLPMFASSEEVALYSLGTNCSQIAFVLILSINNAWTPWMMERLKEGKISEIRRSTTMGAYLFLYAMIGVVLIAPEIVLIMGGRSYVSAVTLLPPLIAGCAIRFIVSQFVSVELYDKHMWRTGIATIIAAIANIAIFYIVVPKFGYISASYVSYAAIVILLALHGLLLYRTHRINLFSTKAIIITIVISVLIMLSGFVVYNIQWLRYVIFSIYLIILAVGAFKYRGKLISIIRSR